MVLFNLVLQDSYDVVNHQSEMYQLKNPKTYCYLICLKLYPLLLLEVLWRGFLWKHFKRGDQDLIRTFGLNFLSFWIFVLLSVPKVNIPYHKLQESWHLPKTSTAKALCLMNCFCVLLQDHKTHTKLQSPMQILFYIYLCRSIFKSTGYYFHLFIIARADYLTSLPHLTFSVVQQCISLFCSELHQVCMWKTECLTHPRNILLWDSKRILLWSKFPFQMWATWFYKTMKGKHTDSIWAHKLQKWKLVGS